MPFCFLLSAFQPFASFAQTIPDEIFGEYLGEAHVTNDLLGIDQTIPDITVELENRNVGNDYFITIPELEMMGIEIPVELDNVIITPYSDGYKLSRTESISFTLENIYIPAIPPYLPEGVYDIPVVISLGNSDIIEYTLNLNLKVVATITYYIGPIPIPIPLTFNIAFIGLHDVPPPPPPPVIITTNLPSGIENQEYGALLEATGETPITWSIISGDLPTGITLNQVTGSLSGIPTEPNIFTFTVQAANLGGTDSKPFTIIIEEEQDTVGIKTPIFEAFKIYPNPTTGVLNLIQKQIPNYELGITNEQLTIEIFDIYSRCQVSCVTSPLVNASTVTLDISHLSAGLYFLKIGTANRVLVEKVIKN